MKCSGAKEANMKKKFYIAVILVVLSVFVSVAQLVKYSEGGRKIYLIGGIVFGLLAIIRVFEMIGQLKKSNLEN